jgi:hypothetical protein
MASIKAGLARLNAKSLSLFTRSLIQEMTGNANFSDPQPALADITTKLTEFEALSTTALNGTKRDLYRRNISEKELKNMLRTLSSYVAMVASGDGDVILSSGFDIKRESEPVPPLTRPVALKAMRSSHSGVVTLDWAKVENAVTYQVSMTTADPAVEAPQWIQTGLTTKSKLEVTNLIPGQYYWFRVMAVGRTDISAYSDPAMVMAA